jgi:hypothetical protein
MHLRGIERGGGGDFRLDEGFWIKEEDEDED